MSVMPPRVSYVIPVYNGEEFLEEALQSVVDQTFRDIEILVVDDGSTDRSIEIATRLQEHDPRVRICRNRFDKGISGALNTGILEARGEYVARMDADDICLPKRTQTQVSYLDRHPAVAAVGMRFEVFGGDRPPWVMKHPTHAIYLAIHFIADSVVGHPTLMIRRRCLLEMGGYQSTEKAEDYDLFSRMSRHYPIVNLRSVGIRYRQHQRNLSRAPTPEFLESIERIGTRHLHALHVSGIHHGPIKKLLLDGGRGLSPFMRWKAYCYLCRVIHEVRKNYRLSVLSPLFWRAHAELLMTLISKRGYYARHHE